MHLLDGRLRSYAWGSRTALAKLCGRPVPSAHPEAELWFGAHPADPAYLERDGAAVSMLDVLAADPTGELGAEVVAKFGARLPFLLKLLAAEEPLSLQAHPSSSQAREGFARENRLGVAIDSSVRNYRDDSAKPELVVALEPFDALAGFRDPSVTVELLESLDVPELKKYVGLLAGQPDSDGLRALFTTWITLPQAALTTLLPAVLDGCVRYATKAQGRGRFSAEVRTSLELAEAYPGDAGVLAALLLNRITLQPGEGLYLDAGNLHAYLRGTAVEIMANSDNVLRGGLTPKHVDVPELLRVLDFHPAAMPVLKAEHRAEDDLAVYSTPAPEFALARTDLTAELPGSVVPTGGPKVLVSVQGSVELDCGGEVLALAQGAAAWISASDPDVTVRASSATAQVFCAAVGRLE
ncbi:mannose-6-phosphate isomerase, class I [Antrihabitans cavernicola]|uniref:mannose-6-phosphate isomerase n=1 Tax=Antrihabitans cavernicola TaxID=2495913 RepID=A0A5A7SEG2_9NOCA|nr:mannose-6-phosphate isomerase, class I [Spelaeibacter cavernicola]KAA0023974.1 mannose-6-phosphate isomerase, class I [Spelaeibacter cavernicola]